MLEFLAGFALGLWVGSIVSIVGIIYLKRRGYIASPSEDLRPIKRQVDELNKWREESESKTSTEWNRIKALEDGLQLLSKHNEMTETVLQGHEDRLDKLDGEVESISGPLGEETVTTVTKLREGDA